MLREFASPRLSLCFFEGGAEFSCFNFDGFPQLLVSKFSSFDGIDQMLGNVLGLGVDRLCPVQVILDSSIGDVGSLS